MTTDLRLFELAAPPATAHIDRCEWFTGCDQPVAYLAFFGPCDNPACTPDECCGATVCEQHAQWERANNPTLKRLTSWTPPCP